MPDQQPRPGIARRLWESIGDPELEQKVIAALDEPAPRLSAPRRLWQNVTSDLSEMVLIFGAILIVLVPAGAVGYALGGDDGLATGLFVGVIILAVAAGALLILGVVVVARLIAALLRRHRDGVEP